MNKNKLLIIGLFILLGLIANPLYTNGDSYCGDGILDAPNEECDDGNFINRDGCSTYCVIEDMTSPDVESASIPFGATDISTMTSQVTIVFTEPIDESSINENTVMIKYDIEDKIDISYSLKDNGKELVIGINEDLYGESIHRIIIKDVKDIPGNQMTDVFVRSFETGVFIDHHPPNIVVNPKGGDFYITQSIRLTPYTGENTWSDEFIDEGAIIYYTLDGSIPTKSSPQFTEVLNTKYNTTLKYFGVDEKGNTGEIYTETYKFSCPTQPNATKVTMYPGCNIQECNYGYELKSNICVMRLGESIDDYKANAVTAPLFSSDTPMTISSKPALYITSEHKGIIPRPIVFKDYSTGTILNFERDTEIKFEDGRAFEGYIIPPSYLYSKHYPIKFGYVFNSIFKLTSDEGADLIFEPSYKMTIPFTDRYDIDAPVTIFTYDPDTQMYHEYGSNMVNVDKENKVVTITSDKTNAFIVAQPGTNFNRIEFTDMVDHWAQYYAEMLYRKEIVKGRSKGIFAPEGILTRAEFTKIALNSINEEIDLNEEIETMPFYDVPMYSWYAPYIKRAKDIGLINGYPDSSFKPDEPINKAEAIKILIKAFGFDISDPGERTDEYRDLDGDQWYYPYVCFMIKNGLANGKRLSNGVFIGHLFGPDQNITRGEMAKMAINTIDHKETLDN